MRYNIAPGQSPHTHITYLRAVVGKHLTLERVLRPWHSRQVLDAWGNTLTTWLWSDRSALATFSYCFYSSNMYVLTDLQPQLSFDTLDPAHFYKVHKHMHAYYYTLLFTGSFACIVKAVTARAVDHICGCAVQCRSQHMETQRAVHDGASLCRCTTTFSTCAACRQDSSWPTALKQWMKACGAQIPRKTS